jgi:hypothetical protein
MTRPSTPFHLGEVITGEPQLYVANPPAPPPDTAAEADQAIPANEPHRFKRFVAAVRRRFRLGPTPEDALTTTLGKALRP